ncbi:MAG: glucodextranase DOMON-like domain-containing protein [Sulfolobales archaeon]
MNIRRSYLFLAILIFTISIYAITPLTIITKAEQPVISVSDPTGDDRGPGYYGYPTATVFAPGVFDLVKFEIYLNATHVIFKVYYKNLGGNPWGGPNGFSLQYTQIYIRTTEIGLPSRLDTIGANVILRPDYGWYYALLLAPGWGEDPVPVGQRSALYYSNGTVIVQDGGNLSVYADANENAIIAVVSRNLLSDLDNIASWKIVVLALSYDGFGPMRVRPVSATGGEWVINGSAYATPDQVKKIARAIAKGVEPRVMDLLIYSPEYKDGVTADQQYTWLDSFDPDRGFPAEIPYTPTVVTTTTTITTTTPVTYTYTVTTTNTIISTTTTTTTTTEIPTIEWTATIGIGVVLLIVGFLVGFFIRRR